MALYHTPYTKMIGQMPFMGKRLVTAHYRKGLHAIRTGNRDGRDTEASFLRVMSGRHNVIAGIASAVALVNTFHAVRTGSLLHGTEAAYDAAFSAAQYGSALIQARMANYLSSQHVSPPRYARSREIPGITYLRDYDASPTWQQDLFTHVGITAFALTTAHAMIAPSLEVHV